MIRKLIKFLVPLAFFGAAAFWFITSPRLLDAEVIAATAPGDAAKGEMVFWQSGCASCHAAPGAKDAERLKLVGGLVLKSPFGNFHAPNISMDPKDGIGSWDFAAFANAMQRGVSPEGEHYYPAFPYASYQRMNLTDIADLYAYMKTLPAVAGIAPEHELPFPFNIRRTLGGWKFLFMREGPAVTLASDVSDQIKRGQYLVEGAGHCGECHTPRNLLGGPKMGEWLAGAKNPEGEGNIPNITGGEGGISAWSEAQITSMLKDGFTPDFDSMGGSMASVVTNWSNTSDADRAAVASYLKAIPQHADGYASAK
ncbi:MAG: c-type cytochrome [Rhizobiaceae bacterium]